MDFQHFMKNNNIYILLKKILITEHPFLIIGFEELFTEK